MEDAALWGFLGTLVGAVVSFAATFLTAKNAANLQKEVAARESLVREQLMQRENYIELQIELNNLLRANAAIFVDDVERSKKGEAWPEIVTDADLSESARRAFAQVSMLNSRVTAHQVRQEVLNVRERLNFCLEARTYEEAHSRHQEAMIAGIDAIDRIGEEIRRCGSAG